MSSIIVRGDIPKLYIEDAEINLKMFRQLPQVTQFYRDENILGYVNYPNKVQDKFLVIARGDRVVVAPFKTRPKWTDYSTLLSSGDNIYEVLGMSIDEHHRLFHTWLAIDSRQLKQIYL